MTSIGFNSFGYLKKTQHLRYLVNSSGGWYSLHLSFPLPETCVSMVQEVVKSSKIHPKCPNLQIWMIGAATKNIMKVKAFAQILLRREVKRGIEVVFLQGEARFLK